MTINRNELPLYIEEPIFVKNNVVITMQLDLDNGEVLFRGYINGRYVAFSEDNSIVPTLRVLNYDLELMEIHQRNEEKVYETLG